MDEYRAIAADFLTVIPALYAALCPVIPILYSVLYPVIPAKAGIHRGMTS